MENKKRHRGRPKMPADQRKRRHLTMRMRDALRDQLQAEAKKNGRSLSEECEFRLEVSLLIGMATVTGAMKPWDGELSDGTAQGRPLAPWEKTALGARDEYRARVAAHEETPHT